MKGFISAMVYGHRPSLEGMSRTQFRNTGKKP